MEARLTKKNRLHMKVAILIHASDHFAECACLELPGKPLITDRESLWV
jgi:hypothetical protein